MYLVIVHHHFRPGGVRRVIETATPHLVAHWPVPLDGVILAAGEAPDPAWLGAFRERLEGTPVRVLVEPAFGYVSEMAPVEKNLKRRVVAGIMKLLDQGDRAVGLIWAHNLGLGRNLCLARELTFACHHTGIALVVHHHDWWFENRWHHFAARREQGFHTLRAIADAVLTASWRTSHVAINRADAAVLRKHFPTRAGWLPNPIERLPKPHPDRVKAAQAWLWEQLGEEAPIWLLPCRLLRRKNIAEALLLTRWLRPEAWLVTTGGASSAEEKPYAERLTAAAWAHRWRLRLGVLEGDESTKPSVPELLAASEAVLLTSLQEGFGLPCLEAAAARRPLLARALPNTTPDLAKFGFRFRQCYREVEVDPALFDWHQERAHQARLFAEWKSLMPRAVSRLAGKPALLAAGREPQPVPFSRLTLTAQLEVLARPIEESWERCAPLNPFLKVWRDRAGAGQLKTTAWPPTATRWLGGRAYARRFLALVPPLLRRPPRHGSSLAAQTEFLHEKLQAEYIYPLLWTSCT